MHVLTPRAEIIFVDKRRTEDYSTITIANDEHCSRHNHESPWSDAY